MKKNQFVEYSERKNMLIGLLKFNKTKSDLYLFKDDLLIEEKLSNYDCEACEANYALVGLQINKKEIKLCKFCYDFIKRIKI